jgi:hypothetical protein
VGLIKKIIKMTAIEFNEKYKDYLEDGHYGLDIHNSEVIEYLDYIFPVIINLLPDFKYSQIKTKFNMARFYYTPYDNNEIGTIVETTIEKILKKEKND